MTSLALIASLLLGAKTNPRLAVMDVQPMGTAPAQIAAVVTEAVVLEIRRQVKTFSVVSSEEIKAMLALEKEKQAIGCNETSCLAEIGGALGAELVVSGSVSRIGSTFLLALKLTDVRHSLVLREGSERISSRNEDGLLDAAAQVVHELFPDSTLEPRDSTVALTTRVPENVWVEPAPARSHALSLSLGGVALAATAVAIVGAVLVANYQASSNQVTSTLATDSVTSPGVTYSSLASQQQSAITWRAVGFSLAGVAVAAAVSSVVTW